MVLLLDDDACMKADGRDTLTHSLRQFLYLEIKMEGADVCFSSSSQSGWKKKAGGSWPEVKGKRGQMASGQQTAERKSRHDAWAEYEENIRIIKEC